MDEQVVVTVNRINVFRGYGNTSPFYWAYEGFVNGERVFDMDSIVTLRSIAKRKYGKNVKVVETWKGQ